MKIWMQLQPEHIYLDVALEGKASVLRFIAASLQNEGCITDKDRVYRGLMAREETMSTGIGDGICFPHTTDPELSGAALLLIRPETPVDFDALDDRKVDIVLAIVVPEHQTSLHIQMLAGASRLCRNPEFLEIVRNAATAQELWQKMKTLEEKMAFH